MQRRAAVWLQIGAGGQQHGCRLLPASEHEYLPDMSTKVAEILCRIDLTLTLPLTINPKPKKTRAPTQRSGLVGVQKQHVAIAAALGALVDIEAVLSE
jgi:hypothetical protein